MTFDHPVSTQPAASFNLQGLLLGADYRITIATNDREALASWLSQYLDNKNTFETFRREGVRFILWMESQGLTLQQLHVEHISAYWRFLADPAPREHWCSTLTPKYQGRKRNPEWRAIKPAPATSPDWRPFVSDLGPTAIRLTQSALFLWIEYLANVGYLRANVMRAIRRRRAKTKASTVDRYLSPEALQSVMSYIAQMPRDSNREAIKAARARFVVLFFCLTGLRRVELAECTTDQIVADAEGWWLKVTGKGAKDAEVPLPDEAVDAFQAYRAALNRVPLPGKPEPLVIDAYNAGRAMSKSSIYAIVTDVMKGTAAQMESSDPRLAAVLRKVTPHWLRHTSATQQLKAGAPLTVVQSNMRHSDISTTRLYLHDERKDRYKATKGFKIAGIAPKPPTPSD